MMGTSSAKFVAPVVYTAADALDISLDDFNKLSQLLFDTSGVFLDQQKSSMLQARLTKRMREIGIRDFHTYYELVQRDPDEHTEFINIMTTNKTDFFREPEHFDILRNDILPQIIKANSSRKLRVWSAACSSGEEVYTLGVVLHEFFRENLALSGWDYKILGTDIDTNVIDTAQRGVYPRNLLKPVRPDLLQRYFLRGRGLNASRYKASPELAAITKFRQHNLLSPLGALSSMKFDVIFLRNVLIYFKVETRLAVIENLTEALSDGGFLFIGHSENLNEVNHKLTSLPSSIFQKGRGTR